MTSNQNPGQHPAPDQHPAPRTREEQLTSRGIDPAAMSAYEAEHARLLDQAITTLAAAARLDVPGYGQEDFAGFLAETLASVAANLGSAGALVAGRSGSWEADLVFQLVVGTSGWNGEYLLEHRTEPVRIYLSVARLARDTAWDRGSIAAGQLGGPYHAELAEIDARHETLDDYDRGAQDAEETAMEAKWAARYRQYAEQFTAAVQAAAAAIPELGVPVVVTTSIDPSGADDDYTSHPDEADGAAYDPIAYRLWAAAMAAVPVPADWFTPAPGAPDGEVR